MDTKLVQFVSEIETLADIRNGDTRNPVSFDLDYPGMAMRFRVVGSITEPTYQAYPINLLWVNLNSQSLYYRKMLQLKSLEANDTSIEGRITDETFLGTWTQVENYLDMFLYPQYYTNGGGSPGPQGPKGDDGYILRGPYNVTTIYSTHETVSYNGSSYASKIDENQGHEPAEGEFWTLVALKGDTPSIDYDAIIDEVLRRLEPTIVGITLSGLPSTITEGNTATLVVTARYSDGSSTVVTSASTLVSNSVYGTLAGATFTAKEVSSDTAVTVTATWIDPDTNTTYTSSQNTTIRNKYPVEVVVSGAASVVEKTSATYTATVRYNTGEVIAVPSTGRVWSVSPSGGTITANGVFTAADVTADTAAQISCSYTEKGVTVVGTRNIVVKNVVVLNSARWSLGERVTDFTKYNGSYIEAMPNSFGTTLNGSFSFTAGVGKFGYFAHPKSWGIARFQDADAPIGYGGWDGAHNNPNPGGVFGPYEVNATVNGVTEAWLIYRTDQANLGLCNWNVSVEPGTGTGTYPT